MASWPKKVKHFTEWAKLMVGEAETNEHGRVPYKKLRTRLAGGSRRFRFRRRRKAKKEE